MPQPIVHYEIAAQDLGKMSAFYEGLLGWKLTSFGPEMGDYNQIDGKQGAVFGIDGGMYPVTDEGDAPGVRLYANVDSADDYAAKAEALGAKVIVPPNTILGGGIRIALFLDPEGNKIGVVETLTPAP
jgi:predicted enzyme related to lactoylglutathione lyase